MQQSITKETAGSFSACTYVRQGKVFMHKTNKKLN